MLYRFHDYTLDLASREVRHGEHTLPGTTAPSVLYQVRGASEARGRLDLTTPQHRTPFVGRETELTVLRERAAQVQQGLGQVVLLSGDAGIGKSRLMQEVTTTLMAEGFTCITCYGSPYYQHTALYPVIAWLQCCIQDDAETPVSERLARLETLVEQAHLDSHTSVPLLAALLQLDLSAAHYPALQLTPQQQRQRTLDILVALVVGLARGQAVLLLVEDLHWVDPTTLEWLGLLMAQGPTAPLLTLLTCRPTFTSPWSGRAHVTLLSVPRLALPQVAQMVHGLGGDVLPAAQLRHIVRQTDGVPLFIEEVTKFVLTAQRLQGQTGRHASERTTPEITIPATLRDSLMARLDQLGPAKSTAQLGAIMGREFPYALLQAVTPLQEDALCQDLHQLVEAELLYQRGVGTTAVYQFKHALIQEAASTSLLRRTRQHYHQHIAQVLEAQFPDTVATQPELLAQHYTEAGLGAQAVAYWYRAGQHAIEHSANVEAMAHLSKGLDILTTLPNNAESTQYELCLQLTLGPALMALRGYGAPDVGETYSRALELCKIKGDTQQYFQALWGLWRFNVVGQGVAQAYPLADELLALAQQKDDAAHLVEAHNARGITLFYLGEFSQALAHFESAATLYDPQGHPSLAFRYGQDPGVICHSFAALSMWILGYPAKAMQRSQEALTLAQDPFSLAYALFWTSLPLQFCRQSHVVQERAETAIALSKEQGFALWLAGGMILQGWARAQHGQVDEGLAQIKPWIGNWSITGSKRPLPYLLSLLSEAYATHGQIQEALDVLANALSEVETYGECWWKAELYRLKGDLLLASPPRQEAEAEACFLRAIDIASHQGAKSLQLRAAISLCRLWQTQEQHEQTRELLAPVYEWFKEGLETVDLIEARALLDALL